MLLLARPYPDEPLASALVRGCRHFGVAMKQVVKSEASGEGKTSGMPLFGVSPLPHFAELFNMNARTLLAAHTVLPYATAFSEVDVWNRGIASALAGTSSNRGMGAVIQSAIHGIAFRRICPDCIAGDLSQRGESYWRLSHQLPGSLVCHVHGLMLRTTQLRIAGTGASYDLPQDCRGRPCVVGPMPDIWLRVATLVAELSRRGLEPPFDRAGSFYKDMAIQRGWLRPGRAVNGELLTTLFMEAFGKPALVACALVRGSQPSWVPLMLHASPGTPFSTLKHILMELFLEGRPVDLSHKPSGPPARSRVDEDKTLAAAFKRVADAYAAAGKRATVSALLQNAGCWGAYRHSKERLPRLRKAVESFQTSERAHRPQALQLLAVPGEDGTLATRQDLIKGGHLLCSQDSAARLGIHWYKMKSLQRDGRILSVRYAARDWYPAFWFDGRVEASHLEAALAEVKGLPLAQQWMAMVRVWGGSVASSSASLAPAHFDNFRQGTVN